MKIKLTKYGVVDNPIYETPLAENYIPGTDNGNVSIPIDYYVIGTIAHPIRVGFPVVIQRENRNGVPVSGIMRTSNVTEITPNGFKTLNSKYSIEVIDQ